MHGKIVNKKKKTKEGLHEPDRRQVEEKISYSRAKKNKKYWVEIEWEKNVQIFCWDSVNDESPIYFRIATRIKFAIFSLHYFINIRSARWLILN